MRYFSRTFGVLGAAIFIGCGGADAGSLSHTDQVGRQVIVGVDISGSRTAEELEAAQELAERVVKSLSFRDRLVMLRMHDVGVRRDRQFWSDTMPSAVRPEQPTAGDRQRLQQAQSGALAVIPMFFDSSQAGRIKNTDVVASLKTIAESAQDGARRRPVVILLSDMIQSTPGLRFESVAGIPGAEWIARQKHEGLVPQLDGVCVAVIGADASTPHGVRLRRFWTDYFEAAGVAISPAAYRYDVTPGAALPCLH